MANTQNSPHTSAHSVSAFSGHQRIAQGHISRVALQLKRTLSQSALDSVMIFDDENSYPVEVDFSGSETEILARLPALPGGSVEGDRAGGTNRDTGDSEGQTATELSQLLGLNEQQQKWLDARLQSPADTIKSLIDTAIRANSEAVTSVASLRSSALQGAVGGRTSQHAREAIQRSIVALGKSLPGYTDALAALQHGDGRGFLHIIEQWPRGLASHLKKLARDAFSGSFTVK
ncbi:DUF2239 family protein [Microbulbifer pacificus]|uniref:DUF2239 family protein n=1 Tax=Microbulbifer pacificus TaxID=407164 RepID=UPI000CF3B44B|nr:DUF2239 family protein [Microbulbifer pacificus]